MALAATTVSFEPSALVPLALVYICDFFASLGSALSVRLLGLAHTATGLWLMYLTVAAVLNMARGFNLPL